MDHYILILGVIVLIGSCLYTMVVIQAIANLIKESTQTLKEMTKDIKETKGKIGRKLSDEAKAKISAANKGKKLSDETKAKISAANKGRKHTAEARAKMSASHMGLNRSDESKARYSAAKKDVKWYYHPKLKINKRLKPEQIMEYEALGYIPGRILKS